MLQKTRVGFLVRRGSLNRAKTLADSIEGLFPVELEGQGDMPDPARNIDFLL